MKKNNLLIEVLTEELPPLSQQLLAKEFAQKITDSVQKIRLCEHNDHQFFSTPRRLGVLVKHVLTQSDSEFKTIKLMPSSVGYNSEGNPTQPLEKKLISLGENLSSLKKIKTIEENNQKNLYIDIEQKGQKLSDEISEIISNSLKSLSIKKLMSYQLEDGWTTVNFVRPIKNLLVIHGETVLNAECMGIKSSDYTIGHRFSSQNKVIQINNSDEYEKVMLKSGCVQVDFDKRKQKITDDISSQVKAINPDFHITEDESLLNEVTSLVELPNVLIGQFEEKYLNIPQECLALTMKSNQKYFPILNKENKLTNHFVIVSNISSKNSKNIIQGNEKVIKPRLADAEFFYNKDKLHTIKAFSKNLNKIIYHNKLGTQHDRAFRVAKILSYISKKLNFSTEIDFETLALYSKADLLSLMVGEFPDLQGIMGRHYALGEGHTKNFSDAIEDHYKPKFSGDTLPRDTLGSMLSIADKIETLIGLFSIDEKPTGLKDPFGLRRNAIGLIRIMIERKIPLDLVEIIDTFFPKEKSKNSDELKAFINDRLINYLKDKEYSSQQIEAVTDSIPSDLHNIIDKLEALKSFIAMKGSNDLAAANKRVTNILKKYNQGLVNEIDIDLFEEAEEKNLYRALNDTKKEIHVAIRDDDYKKALTSLINLKEPIDSFFEKIMVNADDELVKINRHNMLIQLKNEMNCVADISKLSS